MQKFKVENIFVFGQSSRVAVESDLNLIISNPTNEYHILRHYPSLPESYTGILIGKEYEYYDYESQQFVKSQISLKDIDAASQTKGTKFYVDVPGIENPKKLIECIRCEVQKRISDGALYWVQKSQYDVLMFTFEYPELVGEQDLVPIQTLSQKQQSQIKTVPRGDHEGEKSVTIQVVSGVSKIQTKRISVEINFLHGKDFAFMTAYPSELAPNFPMPGEFSQENDYSKEFWGSHVFIV